jgi:phosphatidylserine decarboxylase
VPPEKPSTTNSIFAERPTAPIVPDAYALTAVPLALALAALGLGAPWLAGACAVLTVFVPYFFRNPTRAVPAEADAVVAPADGRVIEVGEVEDEGGRKGLRIGIFLSIFDVHVNRAPLAGRVVAVERQAGRYRAAFDRRAERENARATLVLETACGERVRVAQIAGLLARRIVCHPRVGEWVERGTRYGLIRFGSRADVVLPARAEACVSPGQRVRAGSSVVARLESSS